MVSCPLLSLHNTGDRELLDLTAVNFDTVTVPMFTQYQNCLKNLMIYNRMAGNKVKIKKANGDHGPAIVTLPIWLNP
jgi:hypothetical protein